MLWDLIRAGVAIYSPHTGFDSAAAGINQMVCEKLGLSDIQPLVKFENDEEGLGSGRIGKASPPCTVDELVQQTKEKFALDNLQYVGQLSDSVTAIASACGSGGSFLDAVAKSGCNAFITGEATFHTCLEAKARNVALILVGHYASERFAVEELANVLDSKFADLEVWASDEESDPIGWA